jgi:hypothetical protein
MEHRRYRLKLTAEDLIQHFGEVAPLNESFRSGLAEKVRARLQMWHMRTNGQLHRSVLIGEVHSLND